VKIHDSGNGFALWLSARETYAWAHRPGAAWPCSFLAGKRLLVKVDRYGLLDLQVDGGRGDQDCPADELNAIVVDHAGPKIHASNAAWFVAIGQFTRAEGGAS
jgi:hypothetical protein